MDRYLRAGVVGIMGWLSGCGTDDGGGSESDVARPVSERSSAAVLVATIAVRIEAPATPELAEHAGRFVDYRQIDRIGLSIDGERWGVFPSEDGEGAVAESAPATAGWALDDVPSPALLVAEVGRGERPGEPPPATVGAWVALLETHVAPGGHVALIDEVRLESDEGESVLLRPRLFAPFEVPDGATSAFIGELTVAFDGVGAP